MRTIYVEVAGRPQQRGSKQAFAGKNGGRPLMVDANKKSKPWMAAVAQAAAESINGQDLLFGPLRLTAKFKFKRPQSHFAKRKGGPVLKPDAPEHVTSTPDLDKLLRAIGDAMTGVVYGDDKQIAMVSAWKIYTESSEGVWIAVEQL